MLTQSRAIASEPGLALAAPLFAAMATEGADPPAVPIPPAVAAAWETDPSFAGHVLRLELAVLTHGVRSLLACGAPPFRDDVVRGVHAVVATAGHLEEWSLFEAACRHMLADLRNRPAFARTDSGGRPATPLFTLQLVPLADAYATWARALEVSAAVATPGVGQAAAARGRAAAQLPPAALPVELLAQREAAAAAFFCPPGAGGGGDPLGVGQKVLSSADLRAAAAELYAAAAVGAERSFGPKAPYVEELRLRSTAMRK